jgi:hypothetical protein
VPAAVNWRENVWESVVVMAWCVGLYLMLLVNSRVIV